MFNVLATFQIRFTAKLDGVGSVRVCDSMMCLTDVSGLLCSLPFKLRAFPVTWWIYRALFWSTDRSRPLVSMISHHRKAIRNNLRSVCFPMNLRQAVRNGDWTTVHPSMRPTCSTFYVYRPTKSVYGFNAFLRGYSAFCNMTSDDWLLVSRNWSQRFVFETASH